MSAEETITDTMTQSSGSSSSAGGVVGARETMSLQRDQFHAMLRTELDYIESHVPCQAANRRRPHNELEEWRRKICQWSFRVIDHFRLDREVVAIAMNLFDRFLVRHKSASVTCCPCPSCKRTLDSRTYQLAAMTSLYLSIKLQTCTDVEGGNPKFRQTKRAFRLNAFVELSRGQFVATDICDMEETMLHTLRWQVHPPTPMVFVSYMLATTMPTVHNNSRYDLVLHVLRELSRYLTELAVCLGRACSGKRSSQVAYCAILTAMDLMTESALATPVRQLFASRVTAMIGKPDTGLREVLQKTLWPELLFDDNDRHPISMARDFGLLDVDRLYRLSNASGTKGGGSSHQRMPTSPPVSPKRYANTTDPSSPQHTQAVSPVSVTR